MKSKLYKKHHASKYQFPTHIIKGSGNTKGKLVVGSIAAQNHIEQALGRKLNVAKTMHTLTEWVFCEIKPS